MASVFAKCRLIVLVAGIALVPIAARSSVMDSNWTVLGYFGDLQPNESVIVATVVSMGNCDIGRWPGPAIESPSYVLDLELTLFGTPRVDLPILGTNTFVFSYNCWHIVTKPRLPWIKPGDRVMLRLEHLGDRKASWVNYVFFLPAGAITDSTVLQAVDASSMDWSAVDRCGAGTSYSDLVEAVQRTFRETTYSLGDIQGVLPGAGRK
jgi:hypothetical protein